MLAYVVRKAHGPDNQSISRCSTTALTAHTVVSNAQVDTRKTEPTTNKTARITKQKTGIAGRRLHTAVGGNEFD
jgi:hypothetical protein